MTIIEQIKVEIERLKAKYRRDMYKSNYEGLASGYKIEAYNELLSFLSTIESEHLADASKTSPKDLVKAAEAEEDRVIEEVEKDDRGCPYISSTHVYNAFVRGAKWDREQMMKEAVEKDVHELYTDEEGYHCYVSLGTDYMPGDKVKVIIVKED